MRSVKMDMAINGIEELSFDQIDLVSGGSKELEEAFLWFGAGVVAGMAAAAIVAIIVLA